MPSAFLRFSVGRFSTVRACCCGKFGPGGRHPAPSVYFCYGFCGLLSGPVGELLGRSAPSPVHRCRPFHVCSDTVRPSRFSFAARSVPHSVRPYVKTARPPAPAPKELTVLPPWPAAASTDRHRQKYSLCFKVPSAVQTRPAVPLGSHSCLPFPHSPWQCVPVSHLFAPVLKRLCPPARGQPRPSLPMAGGLAVVCPLALPIPRPCRQGDIFRRAFVFHNMGRPLWKILPVSPSSPCPRSARTPARPSQGAARRGGGSPWQVSQSF